MSLRRASRNARTEYRPAVVGLEDRVVPATTPTNVLAIPAQVAAINAQALAIQEYVSSVANWATSHYNQWGTPAIQAIGATKATAQDDLAQLQLDKAYLQNYATNYLATLIATRDNQIALASQTYTTKQIALNTLYAGLTPAQQVQYHNAYVAQANANASAELNTINQINANYNQQVSQDRAQYNQIINQVNVAIANTQTAVTWSSNLYAYLIHPKATTQIQVILVD
jgi:hypothetical protein